MESSAFLFILLLLVIYVSKVESSDFVCPKKPNPSDGRQLFVTTCDTRVGWKEYQVRIINKCSFDTCILTAYYHSTSCSVP